MMHEYLLPYLHKPATAPSPERSESPLYTIQRPFFMLHFNNIVSSTHMSFRWFHQRLQRIFPKSTSCVPFHNCLTFSVPRLPPDTKLHNHRLSVFRSCLSVTRHYQLSSISGRRPPILVNRGPIERSHNTAEGKVFTEEEFRSVYMEWGYLTVDTMNAAGKQREIFVVPNKTRRMLNLIAVNECKVKGNINTNIKAQAETRN